MRISFDFDCTLGEDVIQNLCNKIKKCDIFIITSRCSGKSHNRDLYSVANRLCIKDENIYFTEGGFKWRKIKELNINIHFDDVAEECELIKLNTDCFPLLLWDEFTKEPIKSDSFGKGIF
jgi:hypothetical protein